MMKCTEILMLEHQVILKRMDILRKDLENGFPDNIDKVEKHCEFIGKYADSFHHAKEEEIYFKWIIEKQPSMEFGPVNVMLSEHNIGRGYVQSAIDGINAHKEGDSSQLAVVKDGLNSFIDLIVPHIDKEDQILYKMAESLNLRSGDGDELMLEKFDSVAKKYESEISQFI